MVLQAVALRPNGEKDKALQVLSEALALAEPAASSGSSSTKASRWPNCDGDGRAGIMPDYTRKLLAAFEADKPRSEDGSTRPLPNL